MTSLRTRLQQRRERIAAVPYDSDEWRIEMSDTQDVRERIEFAEEDVQIVTAMIRNAFQEIQMAARLGDPEAVGDVENRVAKAVLECARARALTTRAEPEPEPDADVIERAG